MSCIAGARVFNAAMDETLTVRLGSDLARALDEAARRTGVS